MKVSNMLDYFGPRVNCRVKLHYLGENIIYESDGNDFPEEEDILNSYIIDIGIEFEDGIPYLDLTLEA